MLIGYARVSSNDQDTAAQVAAFQHGHSAAGTKLGKSGFLSHHHHQNLYISTPA